jgi:hypothetical protein
MMVVCRSVYLKIQGTTLSYLIHLARKEVSSFDLHKTERNIQADLDHTPESHESEVNECLNSAWKNVVIPAIHDTHHSCLRIQSCNIFNPLL